MLFSFQLNTLQLKETPHENSSIVPFSSDCRLFLLNCIQFESRKEHYGSAKVYSQLGSVPEMLSMTAAPLGEECQVPKGIFRRTLIFPVL